MLEFNAHAGTYQWIGLLVSVILPVLVDLVTRRLAKPGVKAIVLALLAALNGFLLELLAGGDNFSLETALLNAVTSFVIAVAAFFGLWRPTYVSGKDGVVQRSVPGGVGPERTAVNQAGL